MGKYYDRNRNARLETRTDAFGKTWTETVGRDANTPQMAISTDERANSSKLFIDMAQAKFSLTGREARTLYQLLHRHYVMTGKIE